MSLMRISNNVYSVGAMAPLVRKEELIKACPYGTSYNSYFIDDRKTAVIDMVYGEYFDDFLYNLGLVADIGAVDYLILNRIRPQHSESLKRFLEVSPKTVIVCSALAKDLLDNIINKPYNCVVVNNGDKLKLGVSVLEFIVQEGIAPDAMCTYFENDCVLFSGNIFSADFCEPKVTDQELIFEKEFMTELSDYYSCYFSHCRGAVDRLLESLAQKQIYYIAPAKGVVVADRIDAVVEKYKSLGRAEKGAAAVVLYASASGCTETLAKAAAEAFAEKNIKTLLLDMSVSNATECKRAVDTADYIAAGSCTVHSNLPACVWNALSEINGMHSGKRFFAFGSYGWSGEGADLLNDRFARLGMTCVCNPVKCCMVPTQTELNSVKQAVDELLNL